MRLLPTPSRLAVRPVTRLLTPSPRCKGLMGAMGLTTSVGKGAHNPFGPNDNNTLQS